MKRSSDDTPAVPIDAEMRPNLFTRSLEVFTGGFIDTFGITHPEPKDKKRAAYFIVGALVVSIVFIIAVFLFIARRL
jgi:phosphotransferase system  glucose/maltose/N-acetylglucosamine-specific IIC component